MMSTLSTENRRAQAGFTLVELAIVLVIVGLLIGGILKGQELIGATRINSVVSQAKVIESSAYTFKDTYGAMPGDMTAAATRLPNCTAANGCAMGTTAAGAATAGDGRVTGAPDALMPDPTAANTTEQMAFFNQLGAAELISGLRTNGATTATVGLTVLGSPLNAASNWRIGFSTADITNVGVAGTTDGNSHYLLLSSVAPGTAITNANIEANGGSGVTVKQASAIDTKMDDSQPGLGIVRGGNTTAVSATAGCVSADADNATYNGQNPQKDCAVLIRTLQ